MDNVLVINLTTFTQHVGVIHPDGRNDAVQILPKRRVHLRAGMTVDPRWIGLNPRAVRVQNPQPSRAVARAETTESVTVGDQP